MTGLVEILVALCAVAGILYVLWRPQWAVVFILVMFPLEQLLQAYFPVLRANKTIINFAVAGLAGFGLVNRILKREPVFSGASNFVAVGALFLYVMSWVAVLWSPSWENARDMMVLGLPYMVLFLLITPLLLEDLYDFRRLAIGFMIVGSIISVLILLNPNAVFTGGRLTIEFGLVGTQTSKTSNPLVLATMGATMALVAVLVRYDRVTPLLNILRLAAFSIGIGLAIGTGSRGQVLAAGLVGVLFFPVARRLLDPRQFVLSSLGFIIFAGVVYASFMLFVGEANRERWDVLGIVSDTSGRFDMVRELFVAWLSSPPHWIFGLGSNAFTSVSSFGDTPYVHNLVVEVFCELGLVSGLVLTVMMWTVYRLGRGLWLTYRYDPSMRSVAALLGALAVYSLVISLKQGSYVAGGPGSLLWWFILAKIAAHEQNLAHAAEAPAPAAEEDWREAYADYAEGYGEGAAEPG